MLSSRPDEWPALVAGFVRPAAEVDGEGLERAVLPVGAHLRWRAPALVLLGALLLAGTLGLGGGGALLVWGLSGLARWPLRVAAVAGLYLAPGLALLRLLWPRDRALSP